MNKVEVNLRRKNFATHVLFAISIIISLLALEEIITEPVGDLDWYMPIVLCSTFWIIIYLIAAWRTFKHIYLFSTAYLTPLVLFHLGLLYQRAVGNVRFPSSWEHGSFSPWLENAGWHSVLALSAFGIGFSIAVSSGKNYLKEISPQLILNSKKIGHWSSIGLLIASIISFILAIQSYGNILNYARHEIFSSNVDSRGLGVFMMIFPGTVLLYYFSAITRRQKIIGLNLVLFAFLLFMFAGYRSLALFPAIVGVALWKKSGRKIPFPFMIGGMFLVLILIAASGYLRTMGKYSELNLNDVNKALDKSSIEDSISEMGASVKALASVLQLVPRTDDYRYGRSYVHSIFDSFPNIGLKINSESSRESAMQQKNTDPDALIRMRPADWLTYRIAPWHFKHGYGVGFSAIAEPFLNFGTFGVFIIFVVLGFGLGKLDSIPLYQSPKVFVFSASMLWFLVSTVRNDSSNLFKPFTFTLLILVLWWIFSKLFFKKSFQWQA